MVLLFSLITMVDLEEVVVVLVPFQVVEEVVDTLVDKVVMLIIVN